MPALPRFDLRSLAADAQRFARAFPSGAASLGRAVADPTTERLVGGVNYLAGTLLDKVKDFQSSAHALVAQRAAPWLERPIPSATVVSFGSSEKGWLPVPAGSLLASAPIDGSVCTFRPVAPFVLAPYAVREASVRSRPGAPTVLELVMEATGDEPLNEALRNGVSLYVDGELEQALATVHALTARVSRVEVSSRDWTRPVVPVAPVVTREGLTPEEALAPDPDGPPAPFGVVTEAFVFPHKFRFVRVRGLEGCAEALPTREVRVSLTFHGDVTLGPLGAQDVRTNCAAVVNLFETFADPLPVAFERGPTPIRVAGLTRQAGRVYGVREAWAVALGERPRRVPDLRRLSATPQAGDPPATFATSLAPSREGDPELCVAFAPSASATLEGRARVASLRILATNGALAERVRVGDVCGRLSLGSSQVPFQNVVAASRYVPPPMDASFALRVVRSAAIRRGGRDALEGLRESLFLGVPSWLGDREAVRAMHQRIEAIEGLEVEIARRTSPRGVAELGYGYRLRVAETPFRGIGELNLMAAAVAEALARCSPVNTFVELSVEGTKTGQRCTHAPRRLV